tara:strand:+ start:186 stop:1154 length:969 start_codon:yes stop_codon:yes gene_type:complete
MKHHIKHVHGLQKLDSSKEKVVACCLVRDGEEYIEAFLDHYFELGVEHIFLIDNGSTDKTIDLAKKDKRVSIYQTNLKFKVYKNILKRYMVEHFSNGGWVLCVDIDEFYDFPYSRKISLNSLIAYLNSHSYTAVAAYLLDMIPNDKNMLSTSRDSNFNRSDYEYYDLSEIDAGEYGKYITMINNKINNDAIKSYSGGIRKKLFNAKPKLLKHPLLYYDKKMEPFYGAHGIANANVADISCVLYHYQLTSNFLEKIDRAVKEENYYCNSKEYKAYKKGYEEGKVEELDVNSFKQLNSIDDLLNNRFLQVTSDFKDWVSSNCRD